MELWKEKKKQTTSSGVNIKLELAIIASSDEDETSDRNGTVSKMHTVHASARRSFDFVRICSPWVKSVMFTSLYPCREVIILKHPHNQRHPIVNTIHHDFNVKINL